MKEEAKKTKAPYMLIVLVAVSLFGWFYWTQIRPSNIRKTCHQWVVDLPGDVEAFRWDIEDDYGEYNAFYQLCLHREGLK